MRRLNAAAVKRSPLKVMKELDAFPKIEESYVEKSSRAGGLSILMVLLIFGLVYGEVKSYIQSEVEYSYSVDTDSESLITMNVDMTIKMKCQSIGADLLDKTGKHNLDHENMLEEIPTPWELTPQQAAHMTHSAAMAKYVRQEYHSIHDKIWNFGYSVDSDSFPERPKDDQTPADACRFRGKLKTRKLSGNFHVTLGKPVQVMGGGHLHLSMMFDETSYNFSHRIHHFSFGDHAAGRVNPLDGDEFITTSSYHTYQYYIKVVPTRVKTYFTDADTYQFSVTEQDRAIDHSAGSHGTPGIFMKYDISPIKVTVEHANKPFWKFLTRLCGVIGGVFACTGIINTVFEFIQDLICCRLGWGKYRKSDSILEPTQPASIIPQTDTNVSHSSMDNNLHTVPLIATG